MPLARYFFFIGGVLLALLFAVDAVAPALPVADRSDSDLPVIRIHTDRKWPERVVFDTRLPAVTPAQIAKTETPVPAPAASAETSTKARVRDAFAQLPPADVTPPTTSDSPKPDAKLPPKRKVAKNHLAPATMQVAQRPQFGFLGNSAWNSTW